MNAPASVVGTIKPKASLRHSWKDGADFYVPAAESKRGLEEHHTICADCGMEKVTFMPPWPERPYRRWIIDGEMMESDVTPRCGGGAWRST